MLRIKGEEAHHEPKGESHSFCMNLVPLLHAWSNGIISLRDRAASRHLEVPSSPHFKRICSIWCWPQMCWIRPCRPSVCQQERDSWRWWLSGSQTHFLVRKTQGMTLNFGLSKYTQMTVFQLLIIHILPQSLLPLSQSRRLHPHQNTVLVNHQKSDTPRVRSKATKRNLA